MGDSKEDSCKITPFGKRLVGNYTWAQGRDHHNLLPEPISTELGQRQILNSQADRFPYVQVRRVPVQSRFQPTNIPPDLIAAARLGRSSAQAIASGIKRAYTMATQIRLQSPTDEEIMVRCQNEVRNPLKALGSSEC